MPERNSSKLRDIFDGHKSDDMSRLERRKVSRLRKIMGWVFIVLVAAVGLAALGWFVFGRNTKFTGDNVKLVIDAPQRVQSGDEIIYVINYANLESVPLRVSEINLKYPEGFSFESASPKPTEDNNLWKLGTLPAGKTGKVEVKGKLLGAKDEVKTITAVMSYIPSNFSSEFQKVESVDTIIKESPLLIKVEAPSNALVGDKLSFTLTLKNASDLKFSNVRITAFYPEGFVFSTAEPEASEDDNVWVFNRIDGQEEKQIKVEGQIESGSTVSSLEFRWQLAIGSGKTFVIQDEIKTTTEVVKGDLSLDLIINGSNESRGVNFGDTLTFTIPYKNNSDTRLSEFTVKLTINSIHTKGGEAVYGTGVLNFDTLKDINSGVVQKAETAPRPNVLESRTITWTKKEVRNLTFLDPNEEGKLEFTVKLKTLDQIKGQVQIGTVDDLAVESVVEMSIGKTGTLVSSTVVKSNTVVNALNTNLKLTSEGRYYDENGNAIGSGPLPPQSGQATNYRIFWTLTNDLHEVKDISVFAVLPKEVQWTNKFDLAAGEMTYNAASRTVTWKINRMPVSVAILKANFEVAFTPTKEQVGSVATLLPRTVMTALDTQTQGKLTQSTNAITTDLSSDTRADGKGIVVQGMELIR